MKLAAIYNVWDGVEHLQGSINCLKKDVDLFIIIYQDVSNYGEKYDPFTEIIEAIKHFPDNKFHLFFYTLEGFGGSINEKKKRNKGIGFANIFGCTHFINMDCDEYYENFGDAKQKYLQSGHKGSVCKMHTYFKNPTLRLDKPENYYVPFIHELKHDTIAGGKEYPFYVDPTRRINETDVVELDIFMHHYSWVRKDIKRKARNSSARANIEKSQLLQDYHSDELKPGFYLKDFDRKLIEVENIFNIS